MSTDLHRRVAKVQRVLAEAAKVLASRTHLDFDAGDLLDGYPNLADEAGDKIEALLKKSNDYDIEGNINAIADLMSEGGVQGDFESYEDDDTGEIIVYFFTPSGANDRTIIYDVWTSTWSFKTVDRWSQDYADRDKSLHDDN